MYAVLLVLCLCPALCAAVDLPDSSLAAQVRQVLGKKRGALRPDDFDGLHYFEADRKGIASLERIAYLHDVELLQLADHIFIEELRKNDLYDQTSQAFAVFLPVRSVGVMGDGRRYDYVVALRAVETIDFMTARWAHLPYEFLEHVSLRIINEVDGISRVTYDISGKPPATIEWE